MFGLIAAIIIFHVLALLTIRNLSKNQVVHIWLFSVVFQTIVDFFLGNNLLAYWYFTKDADFQDILPILVIPPVNMMFLNWYPFQAGLLKRVLYIVCWTIPIVIYEALALLPEPWGYFNYGWWKLGYSAICYPFLLLVMLKFYKWIR